MQFLKLTLKFFKKPNKQIFIGKDKYSKIPCIINLIKITFLKNMTIIIEF